MSTERATLRRLRRPAITEEMIELYRRGCELRDASRDDSDEFIQIAKRLEWKLLGRAPHEVSVFDDLSGDPPAYVSRRNSAAFPDFNGWYTGRQLQQELQASLGHQRTSWAT